jgi:high-affinity iron transporter
LAQKELLPVFQSLVVTLREGVEAALIVAIVLGYLKKVGRSDLARSAYAGLGLAVVLSVILGILFRRLEIDEDRFEGWLMLIGAVFVASMVFWMWRTASKLKGEIETHISKVAAESAEGFSFGVFIFVFTMIAREGVETVLFLGAVQLNTSAMMNFIGGVTGLALAVTFGILFVKGSIKINLRKFFSITSIILIVVAAQLLISGLHELSESMILPSGEREMAIIGPIVKNDAFFYLVVLALTAVMILWQKKSSGTTVPDDASPAERRKILHRAGRERLWTRSLAVGALVLMVLITGDFVYSANTGAVSPPEQVFQQGTDARIPLSRVNDGRMHFFAYNAATGPVRFLIIKLDSGKIGVAFDACQICGSKGYFQDGPQVICRNCTAAINPSSIGQSGGCNPIEIKSTVEGDTIVVSASELDGGSKYFSPSGQK